MALSHARLAKWYLQLAQSLESGIPLPAALDSCAGPPPAGRRLMASQLEAGAGIDEMLANAPGWLPKKDRYFWSAAARSGRLPQVLRTLSDRHERLGAAQLKLILGTLYPVGMLTLAGFLLPVMWQIDFEQGVRSVGDIFNGSYFTQMALIEGSLWGTILVLLVLAKLDSPVIPLLAKCLPGFRRHRIRQSLADFSYALGAFLEAGTPIAKAWAGAGLVSGDPALRRAGDEMRRRIEDGEAPSRYLEKYPCLPGDFRTLYTTGERTGQLDKNLVALGRQFQDEANRGMNFAAVFYPLLMFGAVAIVLVINIIRFYSSYTDGLMKLME